MSRVGEDDTEAEHGEGLESEEEEAYFAATQIIEYKWPPDNPEAETYMLQEQIIDYLEVRGFSRKYPGTCVCLFALLTFLNADALDTATTCRPLSSSIGSG